MLKVLAEMTEKILTNLKEVEGMQRIENDWNKEKKKRLETEDELDKTRFNFFCSNILYVSQFVWANMAVSRNIRRNFFCATKCEFYLNFFYGKVLTRHHDLERISL